MNLLRAFIALEIPNTIQQAILQATRVLQVETRAFIRWIAPENIHLTLKFLGDVPPTSMDDIMQMLRTEADTCQPFDIQIEGLGSFPSLKRPRVVYIGIQAPAGLEALYRGIDSASKRLGYESDAKGGRGFSPHLTIGRVRGDASGTDQQKIRRAIEATTIDSLGTARVDSVHLYKSELKPGGAVYSKLFSTPLNL